MRGMFELCKNLEELYLSNFDSSNVTDMAGMFLACHKIKQIHSTENLNTHKVKYYLLRFEECYELELLDLSNFDMSNATDMFCLFSKYHELREIKGIKNFNN